MNKRAAKSKAAHIITLWIDANLAEGALANWCDDMCDDDTDRLCEGMRQIREEMCRRAAQCGKGG